MRAFIVSVILTVALAVGAGPIKHDNGRIAWWGPNSGDKRVWHSNERLAWWGPTSGDKRMWHYNGQLAWWGTGSGDKRIWHANGQLAWWGPASGDKRCFHPNGEVMSYDCKGVNLRLGEGIVLSARNDGNSGFDAVVDVYGNQISVPGR